MWNTYPDISLSLRETQHSSLIEIKCTASLGYILLTIFSRISYYFGARGAAWIITTWHFNMQLLSNVAAPPVFFRVQLFCTGVKLVLLIPWLLLEADIWGYSCIVHIEGFAQLHCSFARLWAKLTKICKWSFATAPRGVDRTLDCENEKEYILQAVFGY